MKCLGITSNMRMFNFKSVHIIFVQLYLISYIHYRRTVCITLKHSKGRQSEISGEHESLNLPPSYFSNYLIRNKNSVLWCLNDHSLSYILYIAYIIIYFTRKFRIYQKNNLIFRFKWNPILVYPHIMILDFCNPPWMNEFLSQMYLPLLQFIWLMLRGYKMAVS